MEISPEDRKIIEALQAQAEELEYSEELEQEVTDAELMAAYFEGNLRIDEFDEEVLNRHIQIVGPENINQRLIELLDHEVRLEEVGTEGRSLKAADKSGIIKLPITPAVAATQTVAAKRAYHYPSEETASPKKGPVIPTKTWWQQNKVGFSIAASTILVIFSGLFVSGVLQFSPQKNGKTLESSGKPVEERLPKEGDPLLPSTFGLRFLPGSFDSASLESPPTKHLQLASIIPDYNRSYGVSGGSAKNPRIQWQLATVIVKTRYGWGSGTFISPDGYFITNYHIIDAVAQNAAKTGKVATVEITAAKYDRARITPRTPKRPITATLYRADPQHDLALFKVDSLPDGEKAWPYFPLATQMELGQESYVVGSQENGRPWVLQYGDVLKKINVLNGESIVGNLMNTGGRLQTTMLETNMELSNGDSGGPLVNEDGELIGITYAPRIDESQEAKGWHIALPPIKDFLKDLPAQPEHVPFDPWTAGIPMAQLLEPELADGDQDGKIDTLRYQYVMPTEEGKASQLAAYTLFIDFKQRYSKTDPQPSLIPKGLWGMGSLGNFQFDIFLTVRKDGLVAVGYTDDQSLTKEIRIGQTQQSATNTIWHRQDNGRWKVSKTLELTTLIDSERVSQSNLQRLQTIAGPILMPPQKSN